MTLPKLSDFKVSGKKVLLRLDLDVGNDYTRVEDASETLKFLVENRAKTIIIGHKGRPEGKIDNSLSLRPIAEKLSEILGKEVKFVYDIVGQEAKDESQELQEGGIIMLENLRFDSREEKNDEGFAKALASLGEFYVNEAFANSHREHASIVGLPKLLAHAAGMHFVKEVENLSKVFENPKRPVVVIIGGAKEDKLSYVEPFTSFADKIHLVGALPKFKEESNDPKVVIANLLPDKEDITVNSIEKIEEDIKGAGTIVLAGPVGKFEDEGHRLGTKRVFEAVANSNAFKVAGGGDTEAAISLLGLTEKFDWISVGGGAMLEFLAKGTLPGIEALLG